MTKGLYGLQILEMIKFLFTKDKESITNNKLLIINY